MDSSARNQVAPDDDTIAQCLSRLVYKQLVAIAPESDREELTSFSQQQL